MTASQIRPLTICVFRRNDRILVIEAYDPVKEQTFYRPLGGGINFGETSLAALVREIHEEIAAEITDLEYIGTLENIFIYNGAVGHEIVQVYDGRFVDDALYAASSIRGVESNCEPMRIVWKQLDSFSSQLPLYPGGLLELLQAKRREA